MKIDTVSYSSLKDFEKCAHYYKIGYVDHIKLFDSTIETIFGKLIHKCCQNILKAGQEKNGMEYFEKAWDKFSRLYKKYINTKQADYLKDSGLNILENVKSSIEKSFGKIKYEVFSTEERIEMMALENHTQRIKGFIDIVFKTEADEYEISDFKTCNSIYLWKKYLNKETERQLVLYKNYFSRKHDIKLKDIIISFILLEKNPKSKNPVQIVQVTSGKKKIGNHLSYLNNRLTILDNINFFPKNRLNCSMYNGCVLDGTVFCKKQNHFS